MSHLEVSGKKIDLNEEGFLTDSKEWDKQVAEALAKAAEGIDDVNGIAPAVPADESQAVAVRGPAQELSPGGIDLIFNILVAGGIALGDVF